MLPTYYFIGINGIGMSGLAEIMVSQGHRVLGSDISPTIRLDRFEACGITVFTDHHPDHIADSDWIVVVSTAVSSQNSEYRRAVDLGCTIIRRGELLAQIMTDFAQSLGVVGTHGKTTTSSLIMRIFLEWANPSYCIGGLLVDRPHAAIHEKEWFITELDESDGSFLMAKPTHAVVTNIEHEHVDFYPDKAAVVDAFYRFIVDIPGYCAINLDDPLSEKVYKKIANPSRFITYGIDASGARVRAENIQYSWQGISFTLMINNKAIDTVKVRLFGKHNVANVLGAIAISLQNNIPLQHILNGLAAFKGVKRRLELVYQGQDIRIYDDYAHHPTEIISTLEGLYKSFSNTRIITIFQPHRHTRLTNLFKGFTESFSRSNRTYILPVYSAGEIVNHSKTAEELVAGIVSNGSNAVLVSDFDHAITCIMADLHPQDTLVIMGAGDVTRITQSLIPVICQRGGA